MQEGNTYSTKKIIIFGIIILIIAGFVGFYFINKRNQSSDPSGQGKNLFPFGDGTNTGTTGTPSGTGGTVDPTGTPIPADGTPIETSDTQKLRQITQYPVTGYIPWTLNRTVLEPKLDEKTQQTNLVSRIASIDMLRWNIKQTGILMDAEITKEAIISQQKTETKIPNTEELWFGRKGDTAIYRAWNPDSRVITTMTGTIPSPATLDYCTVPFTQDLAVGSKTSDVKELQRYINKKLNLAIAVDGVLGPKTFALIKNLQTSLGINPTGIYDQDTKNTINADCQKITQEFTSDQTKPKRLTVTLLPQNILRGAVSPDGNQVFTLISTNEGVSGTIRAVDGTGARNIFQSPITEWSAQWFNPTTIALTTLASREADGYLYFLNTQTGNFKKILGPVRGLTTLVSPDGQLVLYSNSTDTGLVSFLYNTNTGVNKKFDLTTLPAKCAWQNTITVFCGIPKTITPDQYPDSWYQGITSFADSIWSINTSQNNTNLILSPEQNLDMINLGFSISGDYIYFINKNDQTLWSYRIN